MSYFSFLRQHFGFLFFGFTMMGLANFGNTFFIALHSDAIKQTFGLSNTSFGGLYSAMTLLSAVVMLFSGRYIDKWRLSRFTLFVFFGFATGCVLIGLGNHIIVLAVALFLLRHFGQGLSAHTASTATARAFPQQRGRAVAIIQLGYASTEAIFPLLLVLALGYVSWQGSWLLTAGLLVFIILPYQLFLTRYEPPLNAEAMRAADGLAR
jgi:MFS family permease